MPSSATITSFYTFVANTKARASHVNTNFSNFRGHIIPINTDTATASDGSHDLGSSDHRWRSVYSQQANLEGLTTTTNVSFVPKSATAGGFDILLGSSTIGSFNSSGMSGAFIQTATIPDSALVNQPPEFITQTFTQANTFSSFVVPLLVDTLIVEGCGGGGGGGGGATGTGATAGAGGAGGNGAPICTAFLSVTPGQTLTVFVGPGGAGGSGAIPGNNGNNTQFGSLLFPGGIGGSCASSVTPGPRTRNHLNAAVGGAGGSPNGSAEDGQTTQYTSSKGFAGTNNGFGGPGGGGGSAYGSGANGGAGSVNGSSSGTAGSTAAANTGGGGGGGGGAGATAGNGASGGDGGSGFIRVTYVKSPT